MDIDDLTHEEIATRCIRSSDEGLQKLGRDLQEAVDNERPSTCIVDQIRAYLDEESARMLAEAEREISDGRTQPLDEFLAEGEN